MKIIITIETDTNEVKVTTKQDKPEEVKEVKDSDVNLYAKWFDESCHAWTKSPEYNAMFLKLQQNYANDLLKAKGYLFLNEVYEMLGMTKSNVGQVVGWIYDENNPIEFGIMRGINRDFVNGLKSTVLLDFNVHGNILDKI